MEDVLKGLRTCEYSCENYELDHWADIQRGYITKENIQQSSYEYMYLRDLGDNLETLLKSGKYSDKEIAYKTKEYLDRMYSNFQKNSQKSIKTKKKATMLKQEAFNVVYDILDDLLSNSGYTF